MSVKKTIENRKTKYKDEQTEIIKQIFEILGMDIEKNNNVFTLYELENNKEKIKKIEDLYDDIKKYFYCGSVKGFINPDSPRPWLSVIRSILKQYGYEIITCRKNYKYNKNNIIKTQYYNLINKNM